MTDFPLLTLLTFLPLLGAALIATIRGPAEDVARGARAMALFVGLCTLALAAFAWAAFDPAQPGFQFTERHAWFPALGLTYAMGVDGVSLPFILLTALLIPACVVASWRSITQRVREYMMAFLALETCMIGAFCALDTVLFYVFFEATLIPMFLIIGVWGGPRRVYAAYKFFLYTLAGSVLMLAALIALYALADGQTFIPALMAAPPALPLAVQCALFAGLFASFAVKMPLWPLHTWLPDAHVEAPTAGSVILAGVLLKMGGYGFLRLALPVLPEASAFLAPALFALGCVGIVWTSLIALTARDMKVLIAYSSVAHMGFVVIGLFSGTQEGLEGAVFQMVSHGLVSAALFLCVGVLYDRLHTREIARYGAIAGNMPRFAVLAMVFTLAAVGLPGTSGFVGEILVLLGAWAAAPVVAAVAGLGLILSVAYMLRLYNGVFFGPRENLDAACMRDLTKREAWVLGILAALILALGVQPALLTHVTGPAVAALLAQPG
ncbi:MAG TPA: NADH-quinone oxidoreductase subunit M [Rhodospirillaceae bacterium]|jgi:NADH-quinone oxidoreductase subunit M|nr:NADH-quinone oxidoreductase subunit M [Alphaproteobacteria bacterium]HBH26388.1 NADH-quinone oxidoreductase subunit M [Rhodospirillaceae bacterium]